MMRDSGSIESVIELRDVKKHFVTARGLFRPRLATRAVDGVSLHLKKRETYALVGESGSGKTTLMNVILGLESPTSGVVLANGEVISGKDSKRQRNFRTWAQAVFQDPAGSLNPRMRVHAIVAEPLIINRPELGRREIENRVGRLLEEVGLGARDGSRFPHEFSGGQRQRIAIARALSLEPKLVVLDEPVSALDVSIAAQILNLLRDLQTSHEISYLMITHNLATVGYMADRVAAMYSGRIVETGDSEDVLKSPMHPYTKLLVRAAMPQRLESADELLVSGQKNYSANTTNGGCRFAPRCPHASSVCGEVEPLLRLLDNSRAVACHLC